MLDLAEVLFAEAEQCRSVELRVPADVVVRVRMKIAPLRIAPSFFRGVPPLVYRSRAPVLLLALPIIAALDQQDLLAGGRKFRSERAAACSCADDDDVVVR